MAKQTEEVVRKEIAECIDVNGQVEIENKSGDKTKVWPVDAKAIIDKDDGAKLTGKNVAPIVPGVKPEKDDGKPKAGKPKAATKKS